MMFTTYLGYTPTELADALDFAEAKGWSPPLTREQERYGSKKLGQARTFPVWEACDGKRFSNITIIDLANGRTAIEFDDRAACGVAKRGYLLAPTDVLRGEA